MPFAPTHRVDVSLREVEGRPHVVVEGYVLRDVGLVLDGSSAFPVVDGDSATALSHARDDFQRAFRPSPEAWARGRKLALGKAV